MNEFQLYLTSDRPTEQGFRTVLTAPHHRPYDRFVPTAGHGLGFNDLKVIECRQLIGRLLGEPSVTVGFEEGILIERTVDAAARSFREGRWVEIGYAVSPRSAAPPARRRRRPAATSRTANSRGARRSRAGSARRSAP